MVYSLAATGELGNKLIIFDCDGTLVDSEAIATKVYTEYWASHGVHYSETEFKETFIGKGKLHPDSVAVFNKMPAEAVEEADRLWHEALENALEPVKGMAELISTLKCKVCVGSNSPLEHVKWALDKTGLEKYFGDNVFTAGMVGKPKPAPDLYLHIAKEFKVEPENCIVIEDSVSGVQAAQAAGMKVAAFSGGSHFIPSLEKKLKDANPEWVCANTKDLKRVLNLFLAIRH